jgi:hypothetical protein
MHNYNIIIKDSNNPEFDTEKNVKNSPLYNPHSKRLSFPPVLSHPPAV